MTRKIKLGWGKYTGIFSLCEGDIFSDTSYKGYTICWATCESEAERTYLIRADGKTFYNNRIIPLDIIKKYLDKTYDSKIESTLTWRRVMRKKYKKYGY